MPGKPRILIVGAGIAGLTLAASLERFGITPAVVEAGSASLSRGLALMLTSNVAMALRRVGLDTAVIDQGIVLERIIHADPSGTTVEDDLDLGPSNERYGPNLGITRDGLMSGLSSGLRAQIRYATTITSADGSAGELDVAFSDGTCGRFDLVVGADGIRSAVRKLIYPHAEPAYRSFCAWRTVMQCADCDPVFRLSTTTGCFLGSFPVAPGQVYAFLLAHYAAIPALSREQRLARFKELAAHFHGNVSPLIQQQHDPAQVIFVPVMEVQPPSYYRGRMVLIGDPGLCHLALRPPPEPVTGGRARVRAGLPRGHVTGVRHGSGHQEPLGDQRDRQRADLCRPAVLPGGVPDHPATAMACRRAPRPAHLPPGADHAGERDQRAGS